MQANINQIVYKNFILLNSELLILWEKFKLLILSLLLIDILMYDNSNSDSDYINNNSILDADFVIR